MLAQTPRYDGLSVRPDTYSSLAGRQRTLATRGATEAVLQFSVLVVAGLCSVAVVAVFAPRPQTNVAGEFASTLLVAMLTTAALLSSCGRGPRVRARQERTGRVLGAWFFAFGFVDLTSVLLDSQTQPQPAFWPVFFFIGLGALWLEQHIAASALAKLSRILKVPPRRLVLITSECASRSRLRGRLEAEGFKIVDSIVIRNEADLIGDDSPLKSLHADRADQVLVIGVSGFAVRVLDQLRGIPLPVCLLAPSILYDLLCHRVVDYGVGLGVEVQRAPLSDTQRIVKRAFDVVVASIALLCLSPLLALVALAVKLDSHGPIVFRQKRIGFDGNSFDILKFRTMNVLENGQVVRQASREDPRVTRIGRLLRRTSLDELPQLFNVIRGDMSLIGPRPHAVAHDRQYSGCVSGYALRHRVKPGITGWAQVNGCRGPTPTVAAMQARVNFDNFYVEHWSLGLDMKIMARTVLDLVSPSDAF